MTSGPILQNVYEAVKDLDVNLVYFHTIKPIDKDLINKYKDTKILIFQDVNGLYESISDVPFLKTKKFGVMDNFYTHYGDVNDARKYFGLDTKSIKRSILDESI